MFEAGESLCVLGCGTMGEAIVAGIARAGRLAGTRITVTARRELVAAALRERLGPLGVVASTDNLAACREAAVVLICLKPQRYAEVLDNDEMRAALAGKLVISIAAGVTLDKLAGWLPATALIRAMPNTPCLIGQGMTVLCRFDARSAPQSANVASDDALALALEIFESVGRCIELEAKLMDAVTGLNGSGPAFVYIMLEAMADGGVMMGLPRDVALTIAAQVFRGAASMVLDTDLHPAALKDQVTTPAGCTIAGILTMEDGRIRSVLARTVQEAAKVASSLG